MKAYELIEKGWCQHHYSFNAMGYVTGPDNTNVVAWCIMGALVKAYPYNRNNKVSDYDFRDIVHRIEEEIGNISIIDYNDNPKRTKEEVVALLKKLDI